MFRCLSDDDFAAVAGVSLAEYALLAQRGAPRVQRVLFTTLAAAHLGLRARSLCVLLRPFIGAISVRELGRCIDEGAALICSRLQMSPSCAQYVSNLAPAVRWLLDTFPVRRRGAPTTYHPKYACKIMKFQCVTDVCGNVVACDRVNYCRENDGQYYRRWRESAERKMLCGLGLGDKAYIGCPNVISPPKKSKLCPQLTRKQKIVTKTLQIVRSPIERCFGRLSSRWGALRHSPFSERRTEKLVLAVVHLESVLRPAQPTRHVSVSTMSGEAAEAMWSPQECYDHIAATVSPDMLWTKSSSKCAKRDLVMKPPRLHLL
jgi:hypothetical protein